jgi:hypothetical protein
MNTKAAKKMGVLLAIGAIAVWPAASKRTPNAPAEQQTLTGVISDSMCGATHMEKDKSPAECTHMCVKQGMKYSLVADKKVYTLVGHEADLDKLAGQKATVKGTVNADYVTVDSVAPAK